MTPTLPPNDRLAEDMLLGCVLANAGANMPIALARGIDTDCFYWPENRGLWCELKEMAEADLAIDPVTVQARLRAKQLLQQAGGYPRISELADRIPCETMCEYYADICQELHRDREIIRTCYDMQEEASEGVWSDPDRATRYSQKLADLAKQAERSEVRSTKAVVRAVMEQFEQALENRGQLPGLRTGFVDLDKLTGGFKPGQLIVIAGRPSSGKTAFGVCLASSIGVGPDQKHVGFLSLEMTHQELSTRLLCGLAEVSQNTAMDGYLSERNITSLGLAEVKVRESALHIADTGIHKLPGLIAQAQAWHAEFKLSLLIVDYLQLIGGARQHRNRYEEVSEVSIAMKRLAMELKVPVVVMAQLSRAVEKEERRPRMSDLRDSGQIEQDADIIGFLFEPEKQSPDSTCKEVTLAVAKQRNGPLGDVPLLFYPPQTKFKSASKES